MKRHSMIVVAMAAAPLAFGGCGDLQGSEDQQGSAITSGQITQVYNNGFGQHQTFTAGSTDPNNEFFRSIGTNGRACVNCHQPAAAWGITPTQVQQVFNATGGTDPIFRLNDGSNSPRAAVGTVAQRQAAYSMLLKRGSIRVGIGIPATAEFTLASVIDPYGFASAAELSLFRRPLPTTNLKFLGTVMWDGRELSVPIGLDATAEANARAGLLATQANDATVGHAQAARDLTTTERNNIVSFEVALLTSQVTDRAAGPLSGPNAAGATGGPANEVRQAFHIGINDVLGADPTGQAFSTHVFNLFDSWASQTGTSTQAQARASIARGQNIFNTRTFQIVGVRGVNDVLFGNVNTPLTGTCTTCHDSPNAGDHSTALPLDLGITDPGANAGDGNFDNNTDKMPRYVLRNKTTGATITTSDPGRALIDGKWGHVATFKGPILRGLASRPPYFSNGLAPTLSHVVKFYDTRFHIGLDAQAAQDLANFLAAL